MKSLRMMKTFKSVQTVTDELNEVLQAEESLVDNNNVESNSNGVNWHSGGIHPIRRLLFIQVSN